MGANRLSAEHRLPLPPGTKLNVYEIVGRLASGGFGQTYVAREPFGRLVAIKEYHPVQFAMRIPGSTVLTALPGMEASFAKGRHAFFDEAKTLSRFRHSNIVEIWYFFEANGTAYLVMPLEKGMTLRQWLATGDAPDQATLDRLAERLCSALRRLHRKGLTHCDIACDNIFLRRDGSPVLLDFGAARHRVARQSRSIDCVVKSGFSPPEQYDTETDRCGPWSDIYALGAVLYRCVSKRFPLPAPMRQIGDTLVPARLAAQREYRPEFLAAIEAAMTLDPARRPRSIDEFTERLFAGIKADAPVRQVSFSGMKDHRQGAPQPPRPRWRTPAIAAALSTLIASAAYLGASTVIEREELRGALARTTMRIAGLDARAEQLAQQARKSADEARRVGDIAKQTSAEAEVVKQQNKQFESSLRAEKARADAAERQQRLLEAEVREKPVTSAPFVVVPDLYLDGDGFASTRSKSQAECQKLCAEHEQCKASEYIPKIRQCNLFDNYKTVRDTESDSNVAVKMRSTGQSQSYVNGWSFGTDQIQVGAFASKAEARAQLAEVQRRAPDLLATAVPTLRRLNTPGRPLFRARFAGFSKDEAEKTCSELNRRDIDCYSP